MKKSFVILCLSVLSLSTYAQTNTTITTTTTVTTNTGNYEKYGKTINIGLGVGGYWGYYNVGHSVAVLNANYEIDVAKSFTLAPFVGLYTFSQSYYWGNKNTPYRYYYYRQTIIPVGVKATYYFDNLIKAGPKWDFYLAGSLGFAFVNSTWEPGYDGYRYYYSSPSPLFLDVHIGSEYHINKRFGLFLDLSSGVSTFGLAIH